MNAITRRASEKTWRARLPSWKRTACTGKVVMYFSSKAGTERERVEAISSRVYPPELFSRSSAVRESMVTSCCLYGVSGSPRAIGGVLVEF